MGLAPVSQNRMVWGMEKGMTGKERSDLEEISQLEEGVATHFTPTYILRLMAKAILQLLRDTHAKQDIAK